MTTMNYFSSMLWTSAIGAVLATPALAAPNGQMPYPDFTQGETTSTAATHDWNLGATGASGWSKMDCYTAYDKLSGDQLLDYLAS